MSEERWKPGCLVVFKNGIARQGRDIRAPMERTERALANATDDVIFRVRRTSSAGYARPWPGKP